MIKSLGDTNCELNPIPEKKVKIYFKTLKGKRIKLNKKRKIKAYYKIGRGKEHELDKNYKKYKYRNLGDEYTRLYNKAYKTYILENEIKLPEVEKISTYTGAYTDPAWKQEKIFVNVNKKMIQKKIKQKKYFTEKYEYITTTKINQKNILESLKLNDFYKYKKYKNVRIHFITSIFDNNLSRWDNVGEFSIKDLQKNINEALKKWPKNLVKKFDISTVNYIYYRLRKQLSYKGLSMTATPYKFHSEIKAQRKWIKGKNGHKGYYVPGKKLKLLNKFKIFVQIDYNL